MKILPSGADAVSRSVTLCVGAHGSTYYNSCAVAMRLPPSILSRHIAFVSGSSGRDIIGQSGSLTDLLLGTQDTVLGSFFRHISHG